MTSKKNLSLVTIAALAEQVNTLQAAVSAQEAVVKSTTNAMKSVSLGILLVLTQRYAEDNAEVLWHRAIALLFFAMVLLSVSINRFHSQLS